MIGFKPVLNEVTKAIHNQKMSNAVKSGDPSHYYKPCLQKTGQNKAADKLKLLRKAFMRLEKRDPDASTINTANTEKEAFHTF
jgi:hypothetical protein